MRLLFLAIFLTFLSVDSNGQISDSYRYTEALPYGGYKAMRELIRNELVYPAKALRDKKEGDVIIRFRIVENGRIEATSVVQSVNASIDREALRVFRKILWTPATKNEEVIEMEKTVKIPFHIAKYRKWVKRRGYEALPYPDIAIDTTMLLMEANDALEPPKAIFNNPSQTVQSFIGQQLRYPEEALRRNLNGAVKLEFVVEPHGGITNIHAVQPLGGGCTEEAIRILNLIKWYPGIYQGAAVRVLMELDVTFVLRQ